MTLEYKDEETGTILKGFSQIDLDRLHSEVRQLKVIIGLLGTSALLYVVWLTWYVIHNNVVNNIVARCV